MHLSHCFAIYLNASLTLAFSFVKACYLEQKHHVFALWLEKVYFKIMNGSQRNANITLLNSECLEI